jgi:hypothetical protein
MERGARGSPVVVAGVSARLARPECPVLHRVPIEIRESGQLKAGTEPRHYRGIAMSTSSLGNVSVPVPAVAGHGGSRATLMDDPTYSRL